MILFCILAGIGVLAGLLFLLGLYADNDDCAGIGGAGVLFFLALPLFIACVNANGASSRADHIKENFFLFDQGLLTSDELILEVGDDVLRLCGDAKNDVHLMIPGTGQDCLMDELMERVGEPGER